jgi:mannose-6-phosphate isomerase-like protein (cupin superfamily)
MQYVRKFDVGTLDHSRFDYQVLADLETCLVVACRAPAGLGGPARHVHGCDQVYYLLDGEMELQLGDSRQVAGPDSLVFIPEGTPHRNWNAGDRPELHLDILVPPPARGSALSRPALETDRAPGGAYVRHLADHSYAPTHVPGFGMAPMASPETGSGHITVNSASLSPDSPGTSWHIHPFDQLYFVLEGCLTIDVASEHHEVSPGHLVVLPAGVPHRNRNDGDVTERHVAVLVPAPQGRALDLQVTWQVGPSA